MMLGVTKKLAEAAVEDGLRALPLRRIAKAGNSGAWEQNIKRDVFSGSHCMLSWDENKRLLSCCESENKRLLSWFRPI